MTKQPTNRSDALGRRSVLTGALGVGAAMPLATPAIGQNSGMIFTLATDRPAEATDLAARLRMVSEDRFDFAIEQINAGDRGTLLERVGTGQFDFYLACENVNVGRNPAFGLFAAMPMGMSPSEFQAWRVAGTGQTRWDSLAATYGVKPLAAGEDGPQAMWTRRPLTSMEDLRDAPVGALGLSLRNLRTMGVEAVDLTTSNLDISKLAGLEGITLQQMLASDLISQFPHMLTPNGNRPMAARSAGINLLLWLALTDADRLLVERTLDAHHGRHRLQTQHKAAFAMISGRDRVIATPTPADLWDASRAASSALVREMIATGGMGRIAMEEYMYFLEDVTPWSEIGEVRYVKGRHETLPMSDTSEGAR